MEGRNGFSRRSFLKRAGMAAALGAAGLMGITPEASAKTGTYATLIDLTRCDGCKGKAIPRCVEACRGKATGPMAVFHLFDSPLVLSRPYESYMGCLTVPRRVAEAAQAASVLLDYRTPRRQLVEVIEMAYPGIRREAIHVWTLRGKSRVHRLGRLWEEWKGLGTHLVDDGWTAPSGLQVFTESGTYAPTFLVGSWKDAAGAPHVFLCDGYAATAEAVQAASLSEVLDVDATMLPFSPNFELPIDDEGWLMQLDPRSPDFPGKLGELFGGKVIDAGVVKTYAIF